MIVPYGSPLPFFKADGRDCKGGILTPTTACIIFQIDRRTALSQDIKRLKDRNDTVVSCHICNVTRPSVIQSLHHQFTRNHRTCITEVLMGNKPYLKNHVVPENPR